MINDIVNTGFQPTNIQKSVATTGSTTPSVVSRSTNPAQSTETDATRLKEAVSKLNDYVQNVQRNLSFSIDKDSGQTVIKVYDVQTNELIRQIPSDETLKLAASIDEQVAHFFVKEKV